MATIIDEKPTYCVGDTITVRLEMYNYLGEKKNNGGDFLRAHIYSLKLEAGASGEIKDFNNGTYNVYFTLFWEGEVKISVLLMHPSEGVSALWKSRNHGYKYIKYTGKFLNKSQEVETKCGFSLETTEEKCNYVDKRYGEFFYCIRPPGVACEAFIYLKSGNSPYTNLTKIQKNLFTRSARVRQFNAGDRVLVLVPTAESKFLVKLQGPYVEKVGDVNYKIQQLGKRKPYQVIHVNLIKPWQDREPGKAPCLLAKSNVSAKDVKAADTLSCLQKQQ
ncbi:unnamed protein product [Ranitomeya imitator]|uniref:Integrase p58-like C-terminal domain-containing protein n=1 Tax=Ranitomeya imitator TaxID=111125 RepID=A0ABN9MPI5_9NEOB|nr:unnamed protein product [Ranitomeya imitator]